MRSLQLQSALSEYVEAVAGHLQAEVEAGAEVPFEVGSQTGRRGVGGTPLYCYRALTSAFIAEREPALRRLPGYSEAIKLLEGFDGLERYLARGGADGARAKGKARAGVAMRMLLEDVFEEQSDFHVAPERVHAALERLEQSASAGASQLTLVGTLHGLTISSPELALAKGLTIAHPEAIEGVPPEALGDPPAGSAHGPLLVVHSLQEEDPSAGEVRGRELLRELLRALRLFGDGRVTLGALGWLRLASGTFRPVALGAGGRPHGMLVVTAEQEDELRAFCNLVSRRAPKSGELAWALRRFELGCDRDSPHEALTDCLLALRGLLEPEGPATGLLAGRVAALCATPEARAGLTERVAAAVALERSMIAGAPVKQGTVGAAVDELSGHLRALLSDVICGHLDPDLAALADELLLVPGESADVDGDGEDPCWEAEEDIEGAGGAEEEVPDPAEPESAPAAAERDPAGELANAGRTP
jgi:hypothetical protein